MGAQQKIIAIYSNKELLNKARTWGTGNTGQVMNELSTRKQKGI